ncbi:hypothetical protein DLJ53_14035 [Acuticoccus sediminis]|uniref:NAD(P)-dependent dehydrogenase (Short-subunit alcohol dehydrogenase family) n=1 Tax=Acuticoccus sediminis TaxID=2184697 RepID=A0A8B2NRF3_9HYPH|nr:SDR family oxidoreductase [Acuticoccus sediminis]RAI02465.1 hypothetical protein DLJ53_14035 [Acuticoccus sediminis]
MTRAGQGVLVTGAASGIGWATARRLAASGARVMLADIDGARVEARAAELGPGHSAFAVDLADTAAARSMVGACVEAFGRIDVLVNNAGVTDSSGRTLEEQSPAAFARLMAINLEAALAASREALVRMGATGGGAIVNVASGAAFRAIPYRSAYSASKAGVLEMTRRLASVASGSGVRVNAVAPGFIRTELIAALIAEGRLDPAAAIAKVPLGRMGETGEIAAVIDFLSSPRARGLLGTTLVADGGSQAYGGSGPACRVTPPAHDRDDGPGTVAVLARPGALGDASAAALERGGATVVRLDTGAAGAATLADRLGGSIPAGTRLSGVLHLRDAHDDGPSAVLAAAQASGPLLRHGGGAFVTLVYDWPDDDDATDAASREAGVAMLARTLACEWGGRGVRANTITLPARADPAADEVADVAAFLLSRDAAFVTGAQLPVAAETGMVTGDAR